MRPRNHLLLTLLFLFRFIPLAPSASFLVCNKQRLKKYYFLDNPVQCSPQTVRKIEHCDSTIYRPSTHLKRVEAFFCFTKETTWTTHFYFFGSKIKETKIVDAPPPVHQLCDSWILTKNTRDGPLTTSDGQTFQTQNKIKFAYTWPTARSGITRNHFVIKSSLFYDFFLDSISSPVMPLTGCHISTGYCRSQTKTIIWKKVPGIDCPLVRTFRRQSILLHYNSSSLYRIEIPTMAISIHHWSPCPIRAQHCFPQKLFCTLNGIYIVARLCKSLGNLSFYSPRNRPQRNHIFSYPDPMVTSYINELEDHVAELSTQLGEQHRLLLCQLERNLGVLAQTLGKLFPSEILSLAQGKPTFGIAAGDVLIELACYYAVGKVLPSLALDKGNTFSLLPLTEFAHPRTGILQRGQLVSPNFVIEGKPTYYETYTPGRSFIFRIFSKFVLFENYTLSHSLLQVSSLHIPLKTITDTSFPFTDFAARFHETDSNPNGLTDLHSLLSVLQQTSVDTETIKNSMQLLSSSDVEDADIGQVSSKLQNFAHQTMLLALSEISSPIVTVILFSLQVLAFLWAVAHSFHFIKNFIVPRLVRANNKPLACLSKVNQSSESTCNISDIPSPNSPCSDENFSRPVASQSVNIPHTLRSNNDFRSTHTL